MIQKNWKKQNAREKKQNAREKKKKVQRKFGKQKKNTMHRRRATRQTRQRHGGKAPQANAGTARLACTREEEVTRVQDSRA